MQFDTDLQSPHKDLFMLLRNILIEVGLEETKKERITTYSYKGGGVCHMRTMSYGVDIGFLKGVQFEDKYHALTGKSKKMRVLALEMFKEEWVRYYLKQAIEIVK